jgi:Ca-activated chloride channel family protein
LKKDELFSEKDNMEVGFGHWEWLSWHWFLPSTWLNFSWEQGWILYVLCIVPLIFLWRNRFGLPPRYHVEISSGHQLPPPSPLRFLRFIPDIFISLSIGFIVIALARPQETNTLTEQTSEGIDIIIVLDISESMQIEDFSPNRLEASKKIAVDFIKGRQYDRIGIVLFSGKAYSLSPLTTDYQMLENYIQDINQFLIPETGTAIGNAVGIATIRLQESPSASKVIILISDGDSNAGSLDPITVTQISASYGIKLYSILVGKDGKVPVPTKLFGATKLIDNTINEATLRQIAMIGEGEFFRATSNDDLSRVFKKIDNYEKTEIKEIRYQNTRDFYPMYLHWAIVFWLLWLLSKSTFISNILED